MLLTLASAAFLMGVAGGPHCAAMCGPLCTGVIRIERAEAKAPRAWWQFHAGRLFGYSLAGAAAGQAVQSLAWLTSQGAALRPIWTLLQVAVLVWGLTLLALGRQPVPITTGGQRLWSRVRPLLPRTGGVFSIGVLWTAMPCGLLYSALLAASLTGGPVAGALSMALFAAGSALSLGIAPFLFQRVGMEGNRMRKDWGTRAAGGLIVGASAFALWMDIGHRVAIWCGIA